MIKINKITFFMTAILLGGVVSFIVFHFINKQESESFIEKNLTTILFDSTTLDMGSLILYQPKEVVFNFINNGENPLVIHTLKTSCGCTTSNWIKKRILPGKSSTIHVTYNAASLGYFRKSINVYANIKHNPITLEIFGEVNKE